MKRPPLVPFEGLKYPGSSDANTWLNAQSVAFLNHHIPIEGRQKWRPLFNSRSHGESFAKFSAAIQKQGPTLIIVWEKVYRFDLLNSVLY